MDYKECRFYEEGVGCTHKDAPPNDKSCIGYNACVAKDDDISKKVKPVNTK